MHFSNPRGATTTSTSRASRKSSSLSTEVFQKLLSNDTRSSGANSQKEEAIFQEIRKILKESYSAHKVAPSLDRVLDMQVGATLHSHSKVGLSKSVIAIYGKVEKSVFVYGLVMEDGGQRLTDYYINGRDADRKEKPVEATADMIMDSRGKAVLSSNHQATAMIVAEDDEDSYYPFCVLPKDITAEDKQAIANFVDNAIDAIESQVRDNFAEEDDIVPTLNDYLAHATPRLNIDYNPDFSTVNAAGHPVRSDVRATLSIDLNSGGDSDNRRNRHRINEHSVELAAISAFCNLNFFKDGIGEYGDKFYLPSVVVTSLETGAKLPGLFDLMVAVNLTSPIVGDANWVRLVEWNKLQQAGKDINALIPDLADVLEEDGIDPDTIDLTANDKVFYNFMDRVCEDAPIVQIAVPRGDAASWVAQPLAASAIDAGINEELIQAVDHATGGAFIKILEAEGCRDEFFFEETIDVIHQGYVTESNGRTVDINNYDYMSVATYTMGTANADEIREDWEFTFVTEDDNGADVGSRLNRRLEIQSDMVGGRDNITITGYADLYTLNPRMQELMNEAFIKAGWKPRAKDDSRIRSRQRGNRHLQSVYERHGVSNRSSRNTRRNGARRVRLNR